MTHLSVSSIFSRHIDIRRYFVRELVKAVFVKSILLCTHKLVANTLAKSLRSPVFIGHRRVMTGQTPLALKFLRSERFNFAFEDSFSSRLLFFWITQCVLSMPKLRMGKSNASKRGIHQPNCLNRVRERIA